MKHVAVLYGGKSQEHEISCISALSVVKHLDPSHYIITLIGISETGHWYLQDDSVIGEKNLSIRQDPSLLVFAAPQSGLYCKNKKMEIDVVFPVLHGNFGEDGTVQGLLEVAGLAYVGAGVLGSALGMDKVLAKQVWDYNGLPVVPYTCLEKSSKPEDLKSYWKEVTEKLGQDIFIKPVCSGSSVGISRAKNSDEFEKAVTEAFIYDWRILIEKSIAAREIECSVTGNENPKAYVPGEIAPHHDFYDFEAKYLDPDGAALLVPANLDAEKTQLVKDLAVKAYRTLSLEGMARVDFFMDKNSDELYINEVNTIPGFTSISMFPMMCREAGLDYEALLDHLIELSLARQQRSQSIKYSRI